MLSLKDKVAIVTGAAAGLGKEIALLYAKQGAKVIATDYNSEGLDKLVESARSESLNIVGIKCDISKEENVTSLFEKVISDFSTLDILVNNAGVMDAFEPVGNVQNDMWNKVININLTGTFLMMREAIKIFEPNKKGSIVNVASIAGLEGARAGAAYTASKHGMIGLTKNTGYAYAKSGIRCNVIAPGGMNTSILNDFDMSGVSDIVKEMILPPASSNPRSSDPVEVANVALFLASDEASFVNGAVIVADGGWTAY